MIVCRIVDAEDPVQIADKIFLNLAAIYPTTPIPSHMLFVEYNTKFQNRLKKSISRYILCDKNAIRYEASTPNVPTFT